MIYREGARALRPDQDSIKDLADYFTRHPNTGF